MRTCKECGAEKPITSFARRGRGPYPESRLRTCNPCRYEKRKEARKVAGSVARNSDRIRNWCRGIRYRAKRLGLPCDLTPDMLRGFLIAQDNRCAVSLIEFGDIGEGSPGWNSPSVDRLNPAFGYVRGNIRIVLYSVNAFRGCASDETMVMVARAIVENASLAPVVGVRG